MPESEQVAALRSQLDRGEADAIALALALPDAELLIDEARGRNAARRLGLLVTGTAGVLLEAKRQGHVRAVRPLLSALRYEHGFRLSDAL